MSLIGGVDGKTMDYAVFICTCKNVETLVVHLLDCAKDAIYVEKKRTVLRIGVIGFLKNH